LEGLERKQYLTNAGLFHNNNKLMCFFLK